MAQQTRTTGAADRSIELDAFEEHGEIFKIMLTKKNNQTGRIQSFS